MIHIKDVIILKKARAQLSYLLLSRGAIQTPVVVDKIPDEWEEFSMEGGRWVSVNMPESEDSTACLYEGEAGHIFPNHFHENVETCFIMNEGGKIKINTPEREETINHPNGVCFKPKERHIFTFLTKTKLFIIWKPAFKKGWEADFIEKN
jgi:anti-sigma factor ChrR (cupin superfamily)